MAGRWRTIGATVIRWGKRLAPVVISVGLVTWLVWSITPAKLMEALSGDVWPWLVLATVVQMVVLFAWDTVSVWWLFSLPTGRLPFRTVLRARTDASLWTAINLEIGQGMFAWDLARARGESVRAAIGRCLLLGLFDFGSLQVLAVLGSFVHPIPLVGWLRWVCVGLLTGMLSLPLILHSLPTRWRRRLEAREGASWLKWWSWRHSFLLAAQRLILFVLVLVYAGVGLALIGLPADPGTVLGVIPFVLIAESLPGTGGLGERETALLYLLHPPADKQALLLSFGLIWSVVVILCRVLVGLVSRCLPRPENRPAPRPAEPEVPAEREVVAPHGLGPDWA